MKIFVLIFSLLFLIMCTAQKKQEYAFPPDIQPNVQSIYINQFYKGKDLYKIHCAGCHGIYTKGQENMPNFTDSQIHVYSMKALARSGNHRIMDTLTMQEFNNILTFLQFRNRQ